MTKDEIRELAQEAGFKWGFIKSEGLMDGMINFAKLVAQHEREEIAQFIEQTNLGSLPDETALHYAQLLKSYSTSIRARGQA